MGLGPRALLDLPAIQHNLQRARASAPSSRVMAVVKADAYGHGLVRVARVLGGADALAVARLGEALALRRAGVDRPLVVLEGGFDPEELRAASEHRLELVIHTEEQIRLLGTQRLSRPLRCWLKVDTGMHRIGFRWERAEAAHRALGACQCVAEVAGLMTHLANADDAVDPLTEAQMTRLRDLGARVGGELSAANSAGVLAWPATHADWVRPGVMLYGISPMIGGRAADWGLRPAMTLTSHLIAVHRCQAGDAIGYGGTWTCPEAMPVGVAAIGYGDGYPRHAPTGTPALVNGRRVALVGRVSMDMISLDLRACPDARVGDPVVLWGQGLAAEEVAERAGTIAYELLCGVTARVEHVEAGEAAVRAEAPV
ncbi:MAG: alanine racemase [Chromatiales bacterium]